MSDILLGFGAAVEDMPLPVDVPAEAPPPPTPPLPPEAPVSQIDFSGFNEPEAPAPARTVDATGLFERSMCISVELGRLGNTRKVGNQVIEIDADKAMISVNKQLLDSKQLKAIVTIDGEIRQFIVRRCLPCSFLKSGMYLVPVTKVEEIDEALAVFEAKRLSLIEDFVAAYPGLVLAAQTTLRSVFNPGEYYQSSAQVRKQFTMEWRYVTFGTPSGLAGISKALYDREKEKAESKLQEAAGVVQDALREAMAKLVDHMVDRIKPGENGKPRVFKDSLIKNLTEFLDAFAARNLTNDDQLANLVSRAREIMSGVDANSLRKSDGVRDTVAKGFAELQQSLEGMVIDRPTRKITLDED